jgi:hypothetical protein
MAVNYFHTERPVSSQLTVKVFFPKWQLLTTVLTCRIDSRLVMCEYGTYAEWYQQGKTKILGEKAVFTIPTFAGMKSSTNFCGGNSATNCLSPARQSTSYSGRKSYRPCVCVCVCVCWHMCAFLKRVSLRVLWYSHPCMTYHNSRIYPQMRYVKI